MKKLSKKQIIIGVLFFAVIILLLLPYLFVQIKLTGNKNIVINYGEKYSEPGYHASLFQKDITEDIKVSGNVKDEIGKYEITYSYKFLFYNITAKRTVRVKDVVGPKISLTGGEIYEIVINDPYKEPGFLAVDNVDGVVTDNVKVSGSVNIQELGEYELTYEVTDSNNNHTKAIRTVKVVRKNPMQMGVQEYSLDGWYDEIKLIETSNQGTTYFNKIVMVGDLNISNFYLNGLLPATNSWGSTYLHASSMHTEYINLYGYRIQTSLLDGLKMVSPEMMILNFGTFSTTKITEKQFIESANSMIEKIKDQNPEMKLILASIYPIKQGSNANNFTQEKINRYNFLILEMASKHNLKFLDIASALKDSTGYGNPNYFLADNFQLSYLGHSVVREYIMTHAYVED